MTLFWILLIVVFLFVIGSAGMMKYFDAKHEIKKKTEDND